MSGDPAVRGQRTNPRGFLIKTVENLRPTILPIGIFLFAKADEGSTILIIGAVMSALATLVGGVIAYLQWTRLTYSLGETEIRVESGLLSRKVRSVPIERIQDVSTTQGFLARLLGLVEITFETGAGAGEDIALSYLGEEEGERLRQVIRDRAAEADAVADAAHSEEEAERPPLFAMSPRRILTFGVFNFSLIVFGVAGAFLAQFDDFLPFDVWDIDGWRERLAGPGAWLAGLGALAQAIGIAVLVATLGILGVLTGIVRTALSQWNFRLDRTEKGFRRRRGMFTRTDVTLPIRRVQAAIVDARPVEALFGWRGAALVSLAADAGASHHDVAPLARPEEIAPIITEAKLRMPHEALVWESVSPAHAVATALWRLRWWVVIGLAVLGFQYIAEPDGLLASPWLALIPVVIGAWKSLRTLMALLRLRYSMDEEQVYIRSGWLSSILELVPREKLHTVSIGQGVVARHFGFAYLHLGVAGAYPTIEGLPLKRAHAIRAELMGSMQRRDFSRLN